MTVKDDIAQFAIARGFHPRISAHCRNIDARTASRLQDSLARHCFDRLTVNFQPTWLKAHLGFTHTVLTNRRGA